MVVNIRILIIKTTNINYEKKEEGTVRKRNIVLLCNMGMSTSLLVNKMRAAAQEVGYDCEINAYALQEADEIVDMADCLLIGPQISFELPRLKTTYPDKLVEAIDMLDYGKMDGKKVLNHVKEILGD